MPSLAPLAYNLVIILAAIFLAPIMGVEGLAVGVAIGSLAHLVIQLPALGKVGQRYDLTIGLRHPGVRKVAFLMGPRMLGLAAGQLNFIVVHDPGLGPAGGQCDGLQLCLPAVADPRRRAGRQRGGGAVPDPQPRTPRWARSARFAVRFRPACAC